MDIDGMNVDIFRKGDEGRLAFRFPNFSIIDLKQGRYGFT